MLFKPKFPICQTGSGETYHGTCLVEIYLERLEMWLLRRLFRILRPKSSRLLFPPMERGETHPTVNLELLRQHWFLGWHSLRCACSGRKRTYGGGADDSRGRYWQ